eukprot:6265500-Amphidinium_carterae.1
MDKAVRDAADSDTDLRGFVSMTKGVFRKSHRFLAMGHQSMRPAGWQQPCLMLMSESVSSFPTVRVLL